VGKKLFDDSKIGAYQSLSKKKACHFYFLTNFFQKID